MRYDEKPMRAMMTWTRLLTPYPPRAAFPTRRYGSRFAQPANSVPWGHGGRWLHVARSQDLTKRYL